MPAKSKAQFKFMKAAEKGNVKAPGLSKKEAKEFTAGQDNYKSLPDKKSDRFKKLKKKMSKV